MMQVRKVTQGSIIAGFTYASSRGVRVGARFQSAPRETRMQHYVFKRFSSFSVTAPFCKPASERSHVHQRSKRFCRMQTSQQELLESYRAFPKELKSVILSTVNSSGTPNASYAPCVVDNERNIYIFVSGLAAHTRNLHSTGKVSALFIEDESNVTDVFARKRLSYDCEATLMERETEQWNAIAQQFSDRFGSIVQVLKGLGDFRIFKLIPKSGRFVLGFGAAYNVDPNDIGKLVPTRGDPSESAESTT